MARSLRIFDGRFGRLQLVETEAGEASHAATAPEILILQEGGGLDVMVAAGHAQQLVFQASAKWLRGSFPAVFDAAGGPFTSVGEAITPRIRQLADTLVVEALNDQFLSHERLEFMLQELMLSIVETYLARRSSNSRLWRGSPFADSRIRKALALLRAHPNKEVNMNALASQVGLSRSRFYDLFQTRTGRSPRAYLDLLCVESAIAKLSSGTAKIAEVSAELGFSAQSNFTRFFQQQVGIPPSEYRRAAVKPNTDQRKIPE